MKLTALYASILALIFVGLCLRVVAMRAQLKVAIGDGGDLALRRAARVQGNFAEYVPFALLLIFFVETSALPALVVHGLAICLLVGRVVHAYGLSHMKENLALRLVGMILTFTSLIGAALTLINKHAF
jgi:uncharacterized protein